MQAVKRPARDYQLACVQATLASPDRDKYYVLPTGTGKTRVLTLLIEQLMQAGRVLVVAHRKELIEQTAQSIREDIPSCDVGIVMAEKNETWCDVVVGTIQTLRGARLTRDVLSKQYLFAETTKPFVAVLIDECHHVVPGSNYEWLIQAVREKYPDCQVIGCTATPYRSDKVTMQSILPTCTFYRSIADMQEKEWLCPLEWQSVQIPLMLDSLTVSSISGEKDYNADALYEQISPQTQYIVEQTAPHFGNRPAMVFSCNVAHAEELAVAYRSAGLKALSLNGEDHKTYRAEYLRLWKEGRIQVMCNCALFTEGFDYTPLPPNKNGLGALVIAAPTMSPSKYLQMLGRGTRLKPAGGDFQDCKVFDVAQNANLLETRQITLPKVMPYQVTDLDELIKQKQPIRFGDKAEKQRQVKLIKLQDFGSVSWAAWGYRPNGNVYYCSLGQDQKKKESSYALILPSGRGDGLFYGYILLEQRYEWSWHQLVERPKPLTELAHHFNHVLSIHGRKNLVSKEALWRSQPASPKSLAFLARKDEELGQLARDCFWTGEQVSFEISWLLIRSQVSRLQLALAKEAESVCSTP